MQNDNRLESPPRGWKRAAKFAAYWFQLTMQPIVAVVFVVALAWSFGYVQRNHGWFNDASTSVAETNEEEDAQYACSMLCVFVGAPGRCPVCGMELQKIETSGDPKDRYGVTIDPTSRRLANIATAPALNLPVSTRTEVLGRIEYDETTKAIVPAYVAGWIEDLVVDYTGATIQKGDELAVVYSPDLYADQVGLLQAKSALEKPTGNQRIDRSNEQLYESARKRLIEQGVPQTQLDAIESSGQANSRMKVYAPLGGTVVELLVEEGKYLETGMPILRIADLSTVWLMLEAYPRDASNLKIGQPVTVEIQSLVGKSFEGRVSFVDPMVDPTTRTVKVRVSIPNDAGQIKIGDLAKATLQAAREGDPLVVVPREAVLINGSDSVAYVETEPGRFEFRKVKIAQILGDRISLADGIKAGEQVVASGAFMLDSTFNIQGKASLIDPNRSLVKNEAMLVENAAEAKEIEEAFATLSREDRRLAESQVICPVTEVKLGTMGMGTPIKVDVNGTPVMICCEGCRKSLLESPEKHFAILQRYAAGALNEATTTPDKSSAEAIRDLPQMDLPEMDLPEMDLPEMELPEMELPEMDAPQ